MFRFAKALFLITVLFSLSNCEEREVLNARKKNDQTTNGGDDGETTRAFIAEFASGGASQTACPDGPGASILLDFSTSLLEFDIPVNDTSRNFSQLLDTANDNKVIEGTPVLNEATGDFRGSYTVSDPDGDLDITVCDSNGGGGYANVSRITMIGTLDNINVSGTYEIVNICMTGNTTPIVCEGTFTGSETSN